MRQGRVFQWGINVWAKIGCALSWHLLILLFLLFAVFGPAGSALAEKPIISASETDYPPFCIVDQQGRADGFSVELMRAALAAMGRDVVFKTGTWSQVRSWLEQGEIEALPLVGRTPERENLFDFTFPYMSLHGAIVVRRQTTGIFELADLKGRRVAVMKADNAEEFLRRKDRGIEIHTTPTFENALRGLSDGLYEAVFIQRLVALRLLQNNNFANLRIINRPIEEFRQDFCFAVKKGEHKILSLLNEGLALVMADGTFRRLHAKWFAALQLPTDRQILVGGDHNYPPYEFLDDQGRPSGFNVELIRAVAREVGLDISIRLGPWKEVRSLLERGEIDVLQGMFYSPERNRVFDFTPPHNVNHCVAVVRRGQGPPPASLGQLEGRSIVVQNGDIMHDFVVENGISQRLVSVDSQEDALRELAMGTHDCALVARRTAFYLIEKYGWDNLVVGKHAFLSPEYCFAVQKGHKALVAQLSEGLKALEESGEYRQIFDKWMGVYDDKTNLARIIRNAAIFLAPFLLIFLGVMAWSWSLRRQVARRTAELKESEQHFRNLANSGSALIWTANTEKQLDYFNQVWFDFTGRPMEQEKGEGWINGVHPDDRLKCLDTFYDAFEKHERFSIVYRLLAHDGKYRWVQDDGGPRYDTGGRFIGYIGHCLDITAFKLAKERIEHLNNVLRAIRDVNQLIVRERDRDCLIKNACRLLVDNRGYSGVLMIQTDEEGKPVSWAGAGMGDAFASMQEELLHRKELPACCKKAASAGRVVMIEEQDKLCGQCSFYDQCLGQDIMCAPLENDGHVYGYLSVALAHGLGKDDEEQALFGEMADDIAYALSVLQLQKEQETLEQQRLSLENQLQQAQKMESVGRLAGGVAHDYNNMLSVIIGYAELALDKISPSDDLHADLTEILNAAKRSNEITRQLLAFARKQTINPKLLDLNETVESMLKMLRRLMGEDVELYWRPAPGLWNVKMDPVQIDQILANLCVNARDAIAGRGHITIETHNMEADDKYCLDHAGFDPGQYVTLAVSDDGCGMDRDMIENIFDPFYTTKDSNRGTGLGLATVYGIVRQNNGFINVYSESGKGTTFRLYFPGHQGESGNKIAGRASDIPLGDGETILLVEDEPEIMRMGRIMLERLGYHVMASESPAEAVLIAQDPEKVIDLLMTDVVMPEMNGRELAGRLQAMYPGLKVLFMSGYTADVIADHGVLEEGIDFIEKPFSMRDLGEKVSRMLQKETLNL